MSPRFPDDPSFAAPAPEVPVTPGPRPTFSVIVASWQMADLIGEAIRSALAQTEPPQEVIVCDDGSTDDLAAALAPFGEAVQLLRITHSGGSVAVNTAAHAASGDFVAILDADDRWDTRRLERLGDLAAARPDLDLLTSDAWFVADGERHGRFYEANVFAAVDQSTEILRRNFFFAHIAVRREVWNRYDGFTPDLARGYDWDFALRLLLGGSKAGCVLEPLADYRIHSNSLSADRFQSMMARVQVLDRVAASSSLSRAQRHLMSEARATYRGRALVAHAEQLLLAGSAGRRRACLELLRAPGNPLRRRVLAGAAALAPGPAGKRLRRDAETRGRARSDRAMPGA